MTSRYYTIDEHMGEPHQTCPIEMQDVDRIARVAAYILKHYVDGHDWHEMAVRKGSITLQHMREPNHVIKIFVDYGAKLWKKVGMNNMPPTENPMVVGIELTAHGAFERNIIRDALKADFHFYVDPRQNSASKWWIMPIQGHKYDILFLQCGDCEDISEDLVAKLARRLKEELPAASDQEI